MGEPFHCLGMVCRLERSMHISSYIIKELRLGVRFLFHVYASGLHSSSYFLTEHHDILFGYDQSQGYFGYSLSW